MFRINNINFNNGVYDKSGRYINGAEVAIMNSAEKADIIINDFINLYQVGLDPNIVINKILISRNINENDLTDIDINRINKKIQALYKTTNNIKRGY